MDNRFSWKNFLYSRDSNFQLCNLFDLMIGVGRKEMKLELDNETGLEL